MGYLAAAIQYEPKFLEIQHNLAGLEQSVRQAAEKGAKLIVLPEMCTTGHYFHCLEEIAPYAESIPEGTALGTFAALVQELNIYLAGGIGELEDGCVYNSAFLLGPQGYLGRYRKLHPYCPDNAWASLGDGPIPVFDTPIGKIALIICMDLNYPEAARIAALQGAEVICVPVNWYSPVVPSPIWMTRAFENGVYMVVSNRCGEERGHVFNGNSAILAPDGRILDCLPEGNGFALAEIQPGSSSQDGIFPGRRPELYRELQLIRHQWPGQQLFREFYPPFLTDGAQLKVLAAGYSPQADNMEANLGEINKLVSQAQQEGAGLVLLPELALSGVPGGREQAQRNSLEIGSEIIEQLRQRASKANLFMVLGLILAEEGRLYNSALLMEPGGKYHVYKKSHLTAEEEAWASPGDAASMVVDLPGVRAGLLLGGELYLMEVPRLLACSGCDLLLVPFGESICCRSYPGSAREESHWHIARERANENGCWLAFASRQRQSGIFDPFVFRWPQRESLAEDGAPACLNIDCSEYNQGEAGEIIANPVRQKMLLSTRRPICFYFHKPIEKIYLQCVYYNPGN